MFKKKCALLKLEDRIEFVEMPATHMYQLAALNQRLHKELDKLTTPNVPGLPVFIAEFDGLELVHPGYTLQHGLEYINRLEQTFSAIQAQEKEYPLISLLTEIRALQAQLEQWYEEEEDFA
ncbi:hydrolase/acyltransferase [Paenibacillus sp. MZ04-78.2]|uniref:hydrolase/acyltransferase n=1 Tax=Paenibacillus sp. MZ04-78.2 TaxID=2962034 RepID=UPI0020B76D04|nr:hydrolase/acyltransferase [Paenibacillus sp. MZ04-78.2]MCP3774556.1 hydrolase/acyltransferase [Paenibacillus sp. MZ04-78.2]